MSGAPFLAAVWFLLVALEVTLLLFIPGSALRNHDIPPGARFFLICYSATVLGLFLILVGASFSVIGDLSQRFALNRGALGRFAAALPGAAVAFLLLFYAASWGTYWQMGSFIDSRTFLFMAPHPVQVFHWVDWDAALVVLGVAAAFTFLIHRAIPQRLLTLSPQTRTGVARCWIVALVFCSLGAFFGALYGGWGDRQYTRAAVVYRQSFDNHAGPLPFLLTEIRRRLDGEPWKLSDKKALEIVERPIVSMDEYLAAARQGELKQWNVVLLIVESLRADELRAYGGSRDVMATVEALARESHVFLNAYTQSSHTNYATVVPFSSHYPLRSRAPYNYPESPTYPRVLIYDILKALGYHTAMFSSSNEHWAGMTHFLDTGSLDRYIHAANFEGPTYVMQSDTGFADWVRKTKHAGSVDDRFTVDEALRWLDEVEPQKPFFLSLTFQNSHIPFPIPPNFQRRFGPERIDFRIRFAQFPRDKTEVVKDIYSDSLTYVDSQIARLIQYLKDRGRWDQTLLVLTSDHGQAFYEHGFASHAGPLFDEVMRVPLILRAPGLPADLEKRPVEHVDIAPTVLGLIGLKQHPSFQGRDLFDSSLNPNRSIYMVAQTPLTQQYGIIRSNLKLIYDELLNRYSLFDLGSDPGEHSDIAASQPSLVKDLSRRLLTWRKQQIDYYNDESLHTRKYPPVLVD